MSGTRPSAMVPCIAPRCKAYGLDKSMNDRDNSALATPLTEDVQYGAISRIATALQIVTDRSSIDFQQNDCLVTSARRVGIYLRGIALDSVDEILELVGEGYPVIIANSDGTVEVIEKMSGRKVVVSSIGQRIETSTIGISQLRARLSSQREGQMFVAKKELECDGFSSGVNHGEDHHHLPPLRRFMGMLRLDLRDILTITLFALVAGLLSLATPLAIESMVNIVSWGTYIQPLLVIALMLLACLGIGGILKILQTVLVEIIQRRQFVRIVGDLAHRFPRANRAAIQGEYPRELANRVFDIMTIQKASAVLLLDGISIILTTVLGLLLLAFYHPFLLGFDIVLVLSMIFITWLLGRGGIRTAIDESIIKYQVVHWLQDVLASPSAFKINGGEDLAIQRANRLVSSYIEARRYQFRVVIRQVSFAIALQVVASVAVLGLGGWLVIQGQLTLGQLVASELVVTVVVGAFAKAGKSLEKFYDLMSGMDKVGHLLDIPVDRRTEIGKLPDGPAPVRWDDLEFQNVTGDTHIPATSIVAGAKVAIVGDHPGGKSLLAKSLVGLKLPDQGVVEVAGIDASEAGRGGGGRMLAYAGEPEIFRSTVAENIDLGRSGISQNKIREVLQSLGLWADVLRLPDGLQTILQTGGYPLCKTQCDLLMIVRAVCGRPKLLVIDGSLDGLDKDTRDIAWQFLSAVDAPWTLVVITGDAEIAERCDTQISVHPN